MTVNPHLRTFIKTFFLSLASIYLYSSLRSCNDSSGGHNFDVTTAARMYSPIDTRSENDKKTEFKGLVRDTTKPSQIKVKPIANKYVLSGSDTLFNLLWMQIQSPIDVTPRQLNSLKEWMQKGLRQDTTNIK